MPPRIYADFHNLDDDNQIRLTTEPSGVVADTDQPRSMQQMAQGWRTVAKPIPENDGRLSLDPDDYPL